MTHKLVSKSGDGQRWKQCSECGCTKHGGHWWLAGYKSTDEPPCAVSWDGFKKWAENADPLIFDELKDSHI